MSDLAQQDGGRFAAGAAVAIVVGLLAALGISVALGFPLIWTFGAATLTAAIGMWQGLRMARLHGTPGVAVVKTLAIGLSARAALLAGVGALAVWGDRGAAFGAMTGIVASFVPLFLYESHWFLKRSAGRVPVARGSSEA